MKSIRTPEGIIIWFAIWTLIVMVNSCDPPKTETKEVKPDSLAIDQTALGKIRITLYDSQLSITAYKVFDSTWVIFNAERALEIMLQDYLINTNNHRQIQDSLTTQIAAWKNIVSINHLNLERQQESMRDLAAELDAERERVKKWRNRLDSAISIIRRQEVQLKNCIYSKP